MNPLHYFDPTPDQPDIPSRMADPFENNPQALTRIAAEELQQRLQLAPAIVAELQTDGCGKMFGVLVVRDMHGRIGYLSSFSGMLAGSWIVDGFVPPVFDVDQHLFILDQGETRLMEFSTRIETLLQDPARRTALRRIDELKVEFERRLANLKIQNHSNKSLRKEARLAIAGASVKEQELLLLSLASQRDKRELKELKLECAARILKARQALDQNFDDEISQLSLARKQLSQKLHAALFELYLLRNSAAEVATLRQLFKDNIPPGGSADCAAPKLLQFACLHQLEPLGLAEFWWGAAPPGGVRHHLDFYPPCRGKCGPILPFMLKGIDVETSANASANSLLLPQIIYHDEDIVVIEKPAGLLSVPGKSADPSVASWLADRFPAASGPLLVHRLDMATSGLLLAAKNSAAHKNLQRQFIKRSVKKRYVAILSAALDQPASTIDLPIRVDVDDRPRQMVCYAHGKPALTHLKVIQSGGGNSRVFFYPVTGRTHQLRIHAAHKLGLSAPIVGDPLYGKRAERMLLHADKLSFEHPVTGEKMTWHSQVPF